MIYEHLSPGYRRIADFLLASYQDAAFMTAAQVARAAKVDTALVVRFAQRLGYPGYPELINEIQEDVKRDLKAVYEPPVGDDSPGQALRRTFMQDRNNLEYMQLHLDVETTDRVVETLLAGSRLFVTGEGNAHYLAEAFAARLQAVGISAHLLSGELAGQAAQTASIRTGDVFIGLGLTTMTPGIATVLKVARKAGAKTIGIVGSPTNPMAAVAELVVVTPVQSVGTTPSWTAMAALLHGLSQVIALRKDENAAAATLDANQFLGAYSEMLRQHLSGVRDTIKSNAKQ